MATTTGVNMNLADRHKLASYIAELRHTTHQWGVMDCQLMTVYWVDKLLGTNYAKHIAHKYKDKKSAVVFAKRYLQAPKWLEKVGFEDITEQETIYKDGDVWLQNHGMYYTAWIMFKGLLYSVCVDTGLVNTTPEELSNGFGTDDPTTKFRMI